MASEAFLPKRLKQLLKECGMSQNDLATATGLSKASISQYCSGSTTPSEKALESIAWALGLPVSELGKEKPRVYRQKNVPVDIAAKCMGISPNSLRKVLQDRRSDVGFAIPNEDRFSYYISPVRLMQLVGEEVFWSVVGREPV